MKVEKILPCVCSVPVNFIEDTYAGMPRLTVNRGGYFSAYCPKCGRGSELDFFGYDSAYKALREWNRVQEVCYHMEHKDIDNYEVDYDTLYRDIWADE